MNPDIHPFNTDYRTVDLKKFTVTYFNSDGASNTELIWKEPLQVIRPARGATLEIRDADGRVVCSPHTDIVTYALFDRLYPAKPEGWLNRTFNKALSFVLGVK